MDYDEITSLHTCSDDCREIDMQLSLFIGSVYAEQAFTRSRAVIQSI